ncbi:MAG: hypothetical protein R2732_10350, partial [Microbacteriaceae bacterium]
FFAVDRPRFDLVATRPYSAVAVLPTLLATVLLVQGLMESRPLMEWGWMFIVMLVFKLKQTPLVDVGPREERGSPHSRRERQAEARAAAAASGAGASSGVAATSGAAARTA